MLLPPGPRYEVRKGGIEPSQADTSRTSGGAGAPRPSAVAVAFYHAAMPAGPQSLRGNGWKEVSLAVQ